MELSAWPNCHSACQYALILFPSVWRNLCGLIYFVSVVIGYLIQLIMHLTEAASHCVSGLNSLCEAECIFRCLCTQNWNQIIFVISWKWKRCHLIWLGLNQHLLHKTLCNYLGSGDWRGKKKKQQQKNRLTQSRVEFFVSSSHGIQQGFQWESAKLKQMCSFLFLSLSLINKYCF